MLRHLLKSKIHRGMVTDSDVDYEGSIQIDESIMEEAGLWEGEKVLVASITKGGRLETYVIKGPAGSGMISINGGAAHVIGKGERVVIMAFTMSEKPVNARKILLDETNRIIGKTL